MNTTSNEISNELHKTEYYNKGLKSWWGGFKNIFRKPKKDKENKDNTKKTRKNKNKKIIIRISNKKIIYKFNNNIKYLKMKI